MYLGDPREQQICPDKHTIWEEDNRVEERWQWGARILDLCDLSPEDYATTIFHVSGNTGGGGGDDKKKDQIVADFTDTTVKFTFPYAPKSTLYVVIKDSKGGKQVITIQSGQSSPYTANLSGIDPTSISNIFIGLSEESATSSSCEDDDYEYSVSKGSSPQSKDNVKYVYMKHVDVEAGLTEQKVIDAGVLNALLDGKETRFDYNLQPVEIPGFDDLPDEEYNAILLREQIDLLIFSISNVKEIFLNGTDDQTSSWILNNGTLTIDGKSYKITKFVQENLVNICDTNYQTPDVITFNYRITIQ